MRNPGHSIKAEEQLGEPGSETRNPRIAAVLHEVNVAETKGSGNRTYYVPGSAFEREFGQTPDGHQPGQDLGTTSAADGHQGVVPIPPELRTQIAAAGPKPRQAEVRRLLSALCRWHPLSSRELAAALGRQDAKKLVRNHLSPMVAEGTLAYTIPEMENHPEQRYTAAPPGAATE